MSELPKIKKGAINFVWGAGKTYAGVQDQIFGLLEKELPPGSVFHTVEDVVEDSVSISLFIRQGRDELSYRVPADIVMAHGIADKRYFHIQNFNTGKPIANEYEYLFIPGQWHVNRIVESRYRRNPGWQMTVPDDRIVKTGWLRLDALIEDEAKGDKEPHHWLRVLWAPTHNVTKGSTEEKVPSSYPGFRDHMNDISPFHIFRVSLHPRNRSDKDPTVGQLSWADVVISDFGTMVYEAWALGKPVIFPRWCMDVESIITKHPRSAEAFIFRNRIGLHADSIEEMREMLAEIQNAVIGNRLTRLIKRGLRLKRPRKSAADFRGPGVAEFIDHYVDPTHRGQDARHVADVLTKIAIERGLVE